MAQVQRSEVMGLADYETIRDRFRARVIEEKKIRRVKLGPQASCVFENHDTALLQIQEMLRTERITKESSVLHEIETYNQLVPTERELSATVLVEIDEKGDREKFLFEAKGLERSFSVVVDGEVCRASHDPSREHPERTTAVHYLKFPLGDKAAQALADVAQKKKKASEVSIEVVVEHPRYSARVKLEPITVQSLADDLA